MKTRIAAIVLALFAAMLGGTASYTAHVLKQDMRRMLVDQQISAAGYVARQVDGDIDERVKALEAWASKIDPEMVADSTRLKEFLAERQLLSPLFSGGVFVTDTRGVAVADYPVVAGRIGTDYIDRPHVKTALTTGKTYIGKPVMGKALLVPILPIAAPILDQNRQVIGSLVGVNHLERLGFLGELTGSSYGRTGEYFLISARDGMYVTGTDKTLSLRPLPPPGANPMWDRFAKGVADSGVTTTARGEEVLMSSARLPTSGWTVVVSLPTKEAFQPVSDMIGRVYLVALAAMLLATAVVWLMIRRLLAPLDAAAAHLREMTVGGSPLRQVEIGRDDEIGKLLMSFNALEERVSDLMELNEKIFSAASIGINAFHQDGHCVAANDAICRIAGGSREQLLAQNFRAIESWKRSGLLDAAEDTLRTGQDRQLEIHTTTTFGKEVWLECSLNIFHRGGEPHVMLLAQDISERKHAETTLRESEERFRTVADYTYGWEYWQGADQEMLYVSPSCERVTGYAREEFVNDPALIYRIIHPEDRGGMDAHLRDASRLGECALDFRIVRRDGEIRWIAHGCRPVFRADGKFMGRRASNRDITELKQVEEQLREVNETLERRVDEAVRKNLEQERLLVLQSRHAVMGEMIGNIAHQWRQPLNALGLLLMNLQDSFDYKELDVEEMNRFVLHGQRLIGKMSDTIDDFRNFFRPAKEKASFSLKHVLDETLGLLGASLKSHNIALHIACPEDVMAFGLANEYSQVVMNLINNAKDAIVARKIREGEIHILISRGEGEAILSVRDNGGGVPDQVMARLFEPYFTTKDQGTGIGLYMSKLIIENSMAGRIEARNVGEGAEFSIFCPLAEQGARAVV